MTSHGIFQDYFCAQTQQTDNYQGYWDLLMKGEWPTQKLYYLNGLTKDIKLLCTFLRCQSEKRKIAELVVDFENNPTR